MNELFREFLESYLDGDDYDNKDKEYHKILCHKLPKHIKQLIDKEEYKVKGSCGASNKADVPWIGVFNKNITDTAQKGIYIVYLFKADMTGFYLCLGQGITNFNKYGTNKNEYMEKIANYFKSKTDSDIFSKDGIELNSTTSKGKGYEKVNILAKYYDKNDLSKYNFENDFLELVKIYDNIYNDMDSLSYDEIIENVIFSNEDNMLLVDYADKVIKSAIVEETKQIDETVKLSEIDIPKPKKKVYKNLSTKKIPKVDYIKKAKKDARVGLEGERLVLEYEKEKMIKNNREDLVNKIKWVSKYDDSIGYDIVSYNFDKEGNEYEIYIEVKTTDSNEKNLFFVTNNEINKMRELKEKYWFYRVCKVNKQPKFYKINGLEFEEKFQLKPHTYIADFKSEEE